MHFKCNIKLQFFKKIYFWQDKVGGLTSLQLIAIHGRDDMAWTLFEAIEQFVIVRTIFIYHCC